MAQTQPSSTARVRLGSTKEIATSEDDQNIVRDVYSTKPSSPKRVSVSISQHSTIVGDPTSQSKSNSARRTDALV